MANNPIDLIMETFQADPLAPHNFIPKAMKILGLGGDWTPTTTLRITDQLWPGIHGGQKVTGNPGLSGQKDTRSTIIRQIGISYPDFNAFLKGLYSPEYIKKKYDLSRRQMQILQNLIDRYRTPKFSDSKIEAFIASLPMNERVNPTTTTETVRNKLGKNAPPPHQMERVMQKMGIIAEGGGWDPTQQIYGQYFIEL